jgi:hypothetical protein
MGDFFKSVWSRRRGLEIKGGVIRELIQDIIEGERD